jgi:hypothetical protein
MQKLFIESREFLAGEFKKEAIRAAARITHESTE